MDKDPCFEYVVQKIDNDIDDLFKKAIRRMEMDLEFEEHKMINEIRRQLYPNGSKASDKPLEVINAFTERIDRRLDKNIYLMEGLLMKNIKNIIARLTSKLSEPPTPVTADGSDDEIDVFNFFKHPCKPTSSSSKDDEPDESEFNALNLLLKTKPRRSSKRTSSKSSTDSSSASSSVSSSISSSSSSHMSSHVSSSFGMALLDPESQRQYEKQKAMKEAKIRNIRDLLCSIGDDDFDDCKTAGKF